LYYRGKIVAFLFGCYCFRQLRFSVWGNKQSLNN